MTRKSLLMMAGIGGAAALAVAGTALGSAAHDANTTARQATAIPATSGDTPTLPASDRSGDDSGGQGGSTPSETVTLERAKQIALDHVGGGTVTEIERDRADSRPIWEVEVVEDRGEWEFDIDRETGEILKVDRGDDDNDDDSDDDSDDDRDDG